MAIDNRLSDTAFTMGTVSNLATQIGTAVTYYYLANYQNMPIFNNLFQKSAMVVLYNNVMAEILTNTQASYQALGTTLTQFMLSVVNYKAPNVNSGLKAN